MLAVGFGRGDLRAALRRVNTMRWWTSRPERYRWPAPPVMLGSQLLLEELQNLGRGQCAIVNTEVVDLSIEIRICHELRAS